MGDAHPQGEQAEQRPVRHFLGSLQPGMGSTKELPGALATFRTQKTTPGPSECLPPRRPLLTPPSFCPGSWTRSPEPECDSRILPASPPTHPQPLPCLYLLLLPLCPLPPLAGLSRGSWTGSFTSPFLPGDPDLWDFEAAVPASWSSSPSPTARPPGSCAHVSLFPEVGCGAPGVLLTCIVTASRVSVCLPHGQKLISSPWVLG